MTPNWTVWLVACVVTAATSAAGAVCGWSAQRYRWLPPSLLLVVAGAGSLCLAWPKNLLASNALVLAAGASAGIWLGRFLRSELSLLAFTYAAAVVDLASVMFGPTRWLIESKARGGVSPLRYLAVCAHAGGKLLAVIGAGDVLLVAAIARAMAGLGYRLQTVLLVALAGMLSATLVGLAWRPMPGIPFLAAAVTVALVLDRGSSAGPA